MEESAILHERSCYLPNVFARYLLVNFVVRERISADIPPICSRACFGTMRQDPQLNTEPFGLV